MLELTRYLRVCAVCGVSGFEMDWLCLRCQTRLWKSLGRQQQWLGGLMHYYLWDWLPGDEFMTAIVHSLKGRGRSLLLEPLTLYWPQAPEGCCWAYPLGENEDHAQSLAQACYRNRGGWGVQPLVKTKKTALKQSLQGRQERAALRFLPTESPCDIPWVFVDDVVTTGATAWAAYSVSGSKNFTVWSLFYRKSL